MVLEFREFRFILFLASGLLAASCSVDKTAIREIGQASPGGIQGSAGGSANASGNSGSWYPGGTGGSWVPGGTGGVGGDPGSGGQDAAEPSGTGGGDAGPQPEPDAGPPPITSAGVPYGDWMYYEVQGAVCRDGSQAGYYLRPGVSKNLLVFLNGGGVCYDDFFCGITPLNVNQSLPGETLADATMETFMGAMAPVRQLPPEEGILKKDPRNPVADWTMVYVPYCTGDVYAGTTRDSPVITSTAFPPSAPQQFVGYSNIGLFYRSFGPDYMDSQTVLLAGSSAGGFGALLNFDRTQDFFRNSVVYSVTDSGIPFRDQYLEPCLQKIWRDLWGIDKILPPECTECFHPDGGGLYQLALYMTKVKYPGRMLGGGISSAQDEVIKLFYSAGLNNCSVNTAVEAMSAFMGAGSYPPERFPEGLSDFMTNVLGGDSAGTYAVDGTSHQHLFRPRYYEENDVGMTLADWVGEIIKGNPVHVGVLP